MPKKIEDIKQEIAQLSGRRNVTVRAKFLPKTLNEAERTIDLIASTDSIIDQGFYDEQLSFDDEAIDFSQFDLAPALNSHRQDDVNNIVGEIVKYWKEDVINGDKSISKALITRVKIGEDPDSDKVYQKVRSGLIKKVSIGFMINDYEIVERSDNEKPLVLVTNWTPLEVSFVAIPADKNAKVRNKDISNPQQTGETNSMPQENKSELEKQVEAAKEAERSRCISIRAYAKELGLPEELAEDYVKSGSTLESAKSNMDMFKKYQKETITVQSSNASMTITQDERDKKRQGFEDALVARLDKSEKVTEAARPFMGRSMIQQLDLYVGQRPQEDNLQFVKRTMTTSDLPLILENVANKSLQKRYSLMPRSFSAWTSNGTLKDLKEASIVRAGDFGDLQPMNEKGEYTYAHIGEEGERVKLAKYGRIHSFSDIMIINDDLGAIAQVSSESGVAVSRLENRLAYNVLIANAAMGDTENLFSVAHANDLTVGAIAETTLAAAFKAMREQRSVDGRDGLNLAPRFLIVGPTLEYEAKKALAAITPTAQEDVNLFANSLAIIVDSQITNDAYYFAASPSEIDTVKMFRMEGRETPTVASRVRWDNDSIELKVNHYVAASAPDYRGLVRGKKTSW